MFENFKIMKKNYLIILSIHILKLEISGCDTYSLAGEAKTWYSFASFEVEGNWNKLTNKFCEKFFPISKVQHLRSQVITFTQGEEEGIYQAWNRFNELIEQEPRIDSPMT
jgi:hypothetical protein